MKDITVLFFEGLYVYVFWEKRCIDFLFPEQYPLLFKSKPSQLLLFWWSHPKQLQDHENIPML